MNVIEFAFYNVHEQKNIAKHAFIKTKEPQKTAFFTPTNNKKIEFCA